MLLSSNNTFLSAKTFLAALNSSSSARVLAAPQARQLYLATRFQGSYSRAFSTSATQVRGDGEFAEASNDQVYTPLPVHEKKALMLKYKDKVFDGCGLASRIRQQLRERIQAKGSSYSSPMLGHIIVGDLAQSELYVKLKLRACEEVGIGNKGFKLPADTTEDELMEKVRELSDDPKISGVLVQLPLPGHLDQERVINMIGPEKDVDGLHPFNVGGLALKRHAPYFVSCTPLGVLAILQDTLSQKGETLEGKRVALIGRSNIVGMPMNLLLNKHNAFVTMCFSKTPQALLQETVEAADIVISACGVPGLVKASWIKEGAIVIDVGINFVQVERPAHENSAQPCKAQMTGDIEFNEECLKRCSVVTPVPGGVGPMTVTMLMANLVESWELSLQDSFVGQEISAQQRQTSLRGETILDQKRVKDLESASHEFSFNINLHKDLRRQQDAIDREQAREDRVFSDRIKSHFANKKTGACQSVFRPLKPASSSSKEAKPTKTD